MEKSTSTVIESILKANDKGKIKIKKVDDNTAKGCRDLGASRSGGSLQTRPSMLYTPLRIVRSVSPRTVA